jgi:hypothetical protein
MPVSKEQAVKIARDFLQTRISGDSIRLEQPLSVQRENARRDTPASWCVMFERIDPPNVVTSPGEVVVLVDEETGRPKIDLIP